MNEESAKARIRCQKASTGLARARSNAVLRVPMSFKGYSKGIKDRHACGDIFKKRFGHVDANRYEMAPRVNFLYTYYWEYTRNSLYQIFLPLKVIHSNIFVNQERDCVALVSMW